MQSCGECGLGRCNWGMGRGDGGNGFDILAGRREKRRNLGIEVMEKDGMKKKEGAAAHTGGRAGEM